MSHSRSWYKYKTFDRTMLVYVSALLWWIVDLRSDPQAPQYSAVTWSWYTHDHHRGFNSRIPWSPPEVNVKLAHPNRMWLALGVHVLHWGLLGILTDSFNSRSVKHNLHNYIIILFQPHLVGMNLWLKLFPSAKLLLAWSKFNSVNQLDLQNYYLWISEIAKNQL